MLYPLLTLCRTVDFKTFMYLFFDRNALHNTLIYDTGNGDHREPSYTLIFWCPGSPGDTRTTFKSTHRFRGFGASIKQRNASLTSASRRQLLHKLGCIVITLLASGTYLLIMLWGLIIILISFNGFAHLPFLILNYLAWHIVYALSIIDTLPDRRFQDFYVFIFGRNALHNTLILLLLVRHVDTHILRKRKHDAEEDSAAAEYDS